MSVEGFKKGSVYMRQRITENFHKRFKGGIRVVYQDKPLEPTEQKIRSARLLMAFALVLSEVLKREPTQEELLGITKINPPRIKSIKV